MPVRPDRAAGLGRSGDPALPVGTAMFMGAIGAIGGVRPARRFEMAPEDPVLGRTLRDAYDVRVLPIVVCRCLAQAQRQNRGGTIPVLQSASPNPK